MTRVIRGVPVTAVYILALLVGALFTAVAGPFAISFRQAASTGFEEVLRDGRWWTPLTAILFAQNPLELIFIVPLAALCLGFAERRMGSARVLVTGVGGVVAGVAGGLGVQALGVLGGEMWSRSVQEFDVFDPLILVVAVLLAVTAFVGGIWQARIRVVVLTTCVVFLLYSGQPSDLYRLLAAAAGLFLGRLLHRAPAPHRWLRSPHHEFRVLAAMVVAITAVGPVITLFSGRRYGLLAPLGLLMSGASPSGLPISTECNPLSVTRQCLRDLSLQRLDSAGPVILAILPLVTLLVAAVGLARGRRLAAWLTMIANVALATLGIYYFGFLPLTGTRRVVVPPNFLYWETTLSMSASVVVPLAIALLVARNLRHFTVGTRPGGVAAYVRTLAISLASLSAIYVGGGLLVRNEFSIPVTAADLIADLPERFIPISFLRHEVPEFAPTGAASQLLYDWVGPAFWLVLIVGALMAYLDAGDLNHDLELPRVQALLRRGGGALGHWATWNGNSYWFSADGLVSVAYRVHAGVAITTSEPIGNPVAATAAIADFARYCDDRGWIPVFYAIHQSFVSSVRSMGWRTLLVGEETVVKLESWSTAGKRWQDVRSSISRAERQGVRSVWTTFAELPADWQDQIETLSSQWVAGKALPEMGFTLGSLEELKAPDVGLMIACDAQNRVLGVTSWMPSFRSGRIVGWTLDFMRRIPDGMNGVMEFLIARAAEHFREQGAEVMSLSTAPLANSVTPPGTTNSFGERLLARVGTVMEPVYGFRSLFQFKQKFQPELHPIYLAYPDALAMPVIALALVKAYLPMLSFRYGVKLLAARLRRSTGTTSWSPSESALESASSHQS